MKDTGGTTLERPPAWLQKCVSSLSQGDHQGRPPNKSNHFIHTHTSEKYRCASRTKTPRSGLSCGVLLKRLATWTTVYTLKIKRTVGGKGFRMQMKSVNKTRRQGERQSRVSRPKQAVNVLKYFLDVLGLSCLPC